MSEVKKSSRNGKIELYRFIVSIYVLLFHFYKYLMQPVELTDNYEFGFFLHGAMGVEFFFLVSGWLMAASVKKRINPDENGIVRFKPEDGLSFMKRKYLSIFPKHIIAFIISFEVVVICNDIEMRDLPMAFINSIPNILLVQNTGLSISEPNHVEWYLSAMLIALAVLYPILVKHYDAYTKYIGPLIALLLCGYMTYTDESLTGVFIWTGICFKSVMRAIAEISLGFTAYEISSYMSRKQYTASKRWLFTAAEFGSFALATLYVVSTLPIKYEFFCLAFLFITVTLAFSGVSHGSRILSNKLCFFLGKLSLPIYLSQVAAINITLRYYGNRSENSKIMTAIMFTVLFSALIMPADLIVNNLLFGKDKEDKKNEKKQG